jgi:peptide/nickel transport system ATP-binding protein
VCAAQSPALLETVPGRGHWVACHMNDPLSGHGMAQAEAAA